MVVSQHLEVAGVRVEYKVYLRRDRKPLIKYYVGYNPDAPTSERKWRRTGGDDAVLAVCAAARKELPADAAVSGATAAPPAAAPPAADEAAGKADCLSAPRHATTAETEAATCCVTQELELEKLEPELDEQRRQLFGDEAMPPTEEAMAEPAP